jgi:hypothetical protein
MANISFGAPGSLRKTFQDNKFEMQGGVYARVPCPLVAGAVAADIVHDGFFLAPSVAAPGKFEQAADAKRSTYLVFTGNAEVIIQQPVIADEFPGSELTDAPTGLFGSILAVWPVEALFIGTHGGAAVTLASYTAGRSLTVLNGKLCPADFGTVVGDRVIGYVEAPSAVTGTTSVQCRITL